MRTEKAKAYPSRELDGLNFSLLWRASDRLGVILRPVQREYSADEWLVRDSGREKQTACFFASSVIIFMQAIAGKHHQLSLSGSMGSCVMERWRGGDQQEWLESSGANASRAR